MSNQKKSVSLMSKIFILALVAVFVVLLVMFIAGGRYITDESGIKFVGFVQKTVDGNVPKSGTLYYDDGMTAKVTESGLTVTFKDGTVIENAVKVEFANGSVYEGRMQGLQMSGKGRYTWGAGEDGNSVYEGDFVNDAFTGTGSQYYSDGAIYIGSFADGKKQGTGVFIWNDCDTDNLAQYSYATLSAACEQLTTESVKSLPMGTWYVGNFKEGKKEGYGTYHYDSNDVYCGLFSDDLKNGKGKFFYSNGDIYDGDYVADERSGKGIYLWSDGKKYEGDFSKNAMNGTGVYTWPDGKTVTGTFKDNTFIGEGAEANEAE